MIRELFLPTKIGSYYLFPQRIVGFEVTKTHVSATVVLLSGRKKQVEQNFYKPLELSAVTTYQEQVGTVIANIMKEVGSSNEVHVVLSSVGVLFKELVVPFLSISKISMILPFEIEPLIPFALDQALIDFVVTKQLPDQKQSHILVAIARRDVVEEYRALFLAAGVVPTKITQDVFELYEAYSLVPEVHPKKDDVIALIDIGMHQTRIMLIKNNDIKAVRVLAKGIFHAARFVADAHKLDVITVLDHWRKLGSADHAAEVSQFFSDVTFTLEATRVKSVAEKERLDGLVFSNSMLDIKGFDELIAGAVNLSFMPMRVSQVVHDQTITVKSTLVIGEESLISLTAALTGPFTYDFDFGKEHESADVEKVFMWQLIIAVLLAGSCIGLLVGNSIVSFYMVDNEIVQSEAEAVRTIRREFPMLKTKASSSSLKGANADAEREVIKEENIWYALSPQNRSSFLAYLQELSTRLNVDQLGLTIKRMVLDRDTLTLEGEVRDFEAMRTLEEELKQSEYFKNVPRLQEPKFTLRLTLEPIENEGI